MDPSPKRTPSSNPAGRRDADSRRRAAFREPDGPGPARRGARCSVQTVDRWGSVDGTRAHRADRLQSTCRSRRTANVAHARSACRALRWCVDSGKGGSGTSDAGRTKARAHTCCGQSGIVSQQIWARGGMCGHRGSTPAPGAGAGAGVRRGPNKGEWASREAAGTDGVSRVRNARALHAHEGEMRAERNILGTTYGR